MGRDLLLVLPGSCATGCLFCPFPRTPAPGSAALAAEALRALDEHPGTETLYLVGTDLSRSRSAVPLLASIGRRATPPPRVYCYSTLAAFGALPALRQFPFFAGVVVPVLVGDPALQRDPPRFEDLLARAMVLREQGLAVVPFLFLHEAPPESAAAVVDALARHLSPRTAFAQLVGEPAAGLSRLAPPVGAALDRAAFHGMKVSFVGNAPPPCLDRLHDRHPEAFARVLAREDRERPSDATPHCASCELALRCGWRPGPAGLEGSPPLAPVRRREERHVREFDPDGPEDPRGVRWYFEPSEVPVECTRPWTTMELASTIDPEIVACNPDWLKDRPGFLGSPSLLDAWNGRHYLRMRASFLGHAIDDVCLPHCLLRARSRSETPAGGRSYLAGETEAFLRNLVLLHKELLSGVAEVRSLPTILRISPTAACNNRCVMCTSALARGTGRKGDAPAWLYDEVRRLLPTLRSLHVSGEGEPLASRAFLRFLQETDWSPLRDLEIQLTTNGSLLTPAVVESVLDVPFQSFVVSLNAASPTVYAAVTGSDRFGQVLGNVRGLVSSLHRFRRRRPLVQLSFVAMSTNVADLPAFLDLAAGLGAGVVLPPVETSEATRDLALWRTGDSLGSALDLVGGEIVRWKHDEVFRQHLEALRSSLEIQGRSGDTARG